jgi:hypothetical protein
MKKHHVKIGEIEIPKDYWNMEKDVRKELCEELIDTLLRVLDKQLNPEMDRLIVLDEILVSSIISNEKMENYEICQVMTDLRTIIND